MLLIKAVLKYFGVRSGIRLSLKSDIPPGSGLGLSGAVTTSLVKLISSYLEQRLSPAEVSRISSEIEIDILGRPIGQQDQYAAAYGGLNFMIFTKKGVEVKPIELDDELMRELESRIMLFYTGASRNSANILKKQSEDTRKRSGATFESLLQIRNLAYEMLNTLQLGDLDHFGELLHASWEHKKNVCSDISLPHIDHCYTMARKAGALGGKITGAGGGGFLMFFCDKKARENVRAIMPGLGLQELEVGFSKRGAHLVLNQNGTFEPTVTPEGYLLGMSELVQCVDINLLHRFADIFLKAYENDRQIFILGNGGSAATASHFSCDLAKTVMPDGGHGFRTIPMTDNVALMTAWGNDYGYEYTFSGQMHNLLRPEDVVLAISGGGNSPNVLKALKLARERGAITIGLGGFEGGRMKDLVDHFLIVPSDNYQFIEDVHMMVTHLLTSIIQNRLAEKVEPTGPVLHARNRRFAVAQGFAMH
jgi:D-glycero-alpha-D-manno-heptose-7-phosphate kinase